MRFTVSYLVTCVSYFTGAQVEKFSKTVACIGQSNISAIAKAGPEAKVRNNFP